MKREAIVSALKNRTFRIVAVCIAALLLLLAVWLVFFRGESGQTDEYTPTEREIRLSALLCKIEGVEEASVMIGERDGVAVSAVVVIRGDGGLVTLSRVVDATASALDIKRQDVLVYPAD